jgi:hypothetical protein
MTFDEWLNKEDADGKTTHDRINEEVDMARVMTGNMSHNLARRKLYDWLENAFLEGSKK